MNRNFFSEADRTPERAEISPRQPAERKNAEEQLSQARQDAGTSGNTPAAEKMTGDPETVRDIITEEERTAQDTDARRMERLNAAYEHDRAALAKTDPAFARGTFRDAGHAEGSGEADNYTFRKILAMEKSGFMTDLEKDKEKDL